MQYVEWHVKYRGISYPTICVYIDNYAMHMPYTNGFMVMDMMFINVSATMIDVSFHHFQVVFMMTNFTSTKKIVNMAENDNEVKHPKRFCVLLSNQPFLCPQNPRNPLWSFHVNIRTLQSGF